jgi:tetratricopeptide (TPR) repeat protein
VLLDNASDSEQVRPLLPGYPGCTAMITSRDSLSGLVATDGARRLELDVLPMADAVALLRSLIGPRADAEPDVTAKLAGLCARLPLALRIAAELAAAHPQAPLRQLMDELATARLDYLNAGDDRADVRAVISWSVRHLPGKAAETLTLMGLHPGAEVDAYAVAALADITVVRARKTLRQLNRASLLHASGVGRYAMHDLLRAYAREEAASEMGGRSDSALTRLIDYYLAAAAAAMDAMVPAEAYQRPQVAVTAIAVPDLREETDGRAWLDHERENLIAVIVHCADHGRGRQAAALGSTLYRYLMLGSHLSEAQLIYGHVLRAVRLSGDLAAEAEALNGLGSAVSMKGQLVDAVGHYQAALECYRRRGDRGGEARVLNNIGTCEQRLHRYQSAVRYHHRAIAAFQDAGDDFGAARALAELAFDETLLDLHDEAAEHLRCAQRVFRESKDQVREAEVLSRFGEISEGKGQFVQAIDCFERALAIFRYARNPTGIAAQLYNLGEVSLRQGRYQHAIGYMRQALAWFRQVGDQYSETMTLRSLAEALHGAGQPAAARDELETVVRVAGETGNTYMQASAHRDLAEIHRTQRQNEQARHHWQLALDLYTLLGAPEAEQIRSQLGL